MTLRIAQVAPIILPTPPLHYGGTERVVNDLTEALVALGHKVTLFASSDSNTSAELVCATPSLAQLQEKKGKLPPGMPGVLETVLLEKLRGRLADFDIVHCHGEFFHAALLGTQRKKSLTTIHWRVDEADRQLFFASFPDLPIAAISHAQAASIPASSCAGIVYHGIPEARFPFYPEHHNYLAFIGRMTDQKRPDRAIELARSSSLPLRLAGDIDVGNPDYFDRFVKPELGAEVHYQGPVDDRQKADFLGNAMALVFPIDWPEPFGLVMIEAMACGTPVIAWRNGAVEEIVEPGVSGFVVDNLEDARQAVKRIATLDRTAVRESFLARFTSRRMAQDYVALYRSLIDRNSMG
ncbi:glycosyltransferase family 4 protein [Pistricoccus aurantiacus]|uniref:Glycosyltransferase family 4 protein n=1 Tax=Pistricoccus aurantiacus TaxID=1883414 RepID=A0A5B8SXE4_9GAMM|nr:glycosyltransferase family 4 protein [Pistricoccus aurantiacus]QEA39478.1 glycosyltransferase family 4 protein [Pistricoccus aurantiacus]